MSDEGSRARALLHPAVCAANKILTISTDTATVLALKIDAD